MTAEKIVRAYSDMGPKMFSKKMLFWELRGLPIYEPQPVEEAMVKVVKKHDTRGGEDALLYNAECPSSPRAKT